MIALPLLLAWAITGASYEFGFVSKAWYGATPGEPLERTLESAKSDAPDIGLPAAVAAARELAGTRTVTAVDIPAANDEAATYGVWFRDGHDPWEHGDYSGDMLVSVDRATAKARVTYGGPEPWAQMIDEDWNFPVHAGWIVDPWWRIAWGVLGLVPLLLAITGVSTWLYKRGLRKRRLRAAAAA
jgi:hypothetical protein